MDALEASKIGENPKHSYILESKKVLLLQYGREDKEMKYQATRGYDILKQRVCICGCKYKVTLDMKRTIV